MIGELKIEFSGSFQCRLATDPAPSGASVSHPDSISAPAYPSPGKGWTFAYRERSFDRIIRLSNPVQLRSALIDPWEDTLVDRVLVDQGVGLAEVAGDGFIGSPVSLGSGVLFSGLMTQEEMTNFSLSLGGSLFTASQLLPAPRLTVTVDPASTANYNNTKPARIAASQAGMDPLRIQVLALPIYSLNYANFFGFKGRYQNFALTSAYIAMFLNPTLALAQINAADYNWTGDITFHRFDGDTLTGRINGSIRAVKI